MANQAVERAPSFYGGLPGEMIGEFFGTMVLILFGDGCVAVFGLFGSSQGVGIGANT
jgi:glycerol uptake facilitator protein